MSTQYHWYSSLLLLGGSLSFFTVLSTGIEHASSDVLSFHPPSVSGPFHKSGEDNDLGQPPSRSGGGGRNATLLAQPCPNPVIALVPGDGVVRLYEEEECLDEAAVSPSAQATLAHTSKSMPSVWVYIPEVYADPEQMAELVLIDNQRRVERWEVVLPSTEGIVCIPLSYPLEADNVYQWRFEVKVNGQRPSENPRVGGLIQQTQQAEAYWHDELTQLGHQHWSAPEDTAIATQWTQQLEQQGLGAIATIPILRSCVEQNVALQPVPH